MTGTADTCTSLQMKSFHFESMQRRKVREQMKGIGIAAVVLAAVAFAVGVFVGVRSIPDAKRYVEMRRM